MINKGIVLGNLGGDPEIKRSQTGSSIATFSLATSETWRDKATGERKQKTEWHRVVIFNEALVKVAEQFLKKGSRVYLEGQMRTRTWKDKANIEQRTTEIVLGPFHSQLVLCDRANGNRPPDADADSYGEMPGASAPAVDLKDEIPF
jgi:single-strand DNA-binding protein